MCRILLFFFSIILPQVILAQDNINQTDTLGRRQGFWKKTDTEGKIIYHGQFRDGVPYGQFLYLYPDGKIKTESQMSENGKIASTLTYYPNGKKMAEGIYVEEKKHGLWKFFNEAEGSLISEETYVMGVKNGISKTYFPDGGIAEILTWENGVKSGLWEQYYSDGHIKFRGIYLNNEKHGDLTAFYLSGRVMFTGKYEHGKRAGQWVYFDETGKIRKNENE